jgi:hypothetical protein
MAVDGDRVDRSHLKALAPGTQRLGDELPELRRVALPRWRAGRIDHREADLVAG